MRRGLIIAEEDLLSRILRFHGRLDLNQKLSELVLICGLAEHEHASVQTIADGSIDSCRNPLVLARVKYRSVDAAPGSRLLHPRVVRGFVLKDARPILSKQVSDDTCKGNPLFDDLFGFDFLGSVN